MNEKDAYLITRSGYRYSDQVSNSSINDTVVIIKRYAVVYRLQDSFTCDYDSNCFGDSSTESLTFYEVKKDYIKV